MRHKWLRKLALACAGLLVAAALVGCDSDDDSPPAATPSVTVSPLPTSSPSAAPSSPPSAAPTSTPSAVASATPSPVPSPPVGPFVVARETSPGALAVGSDGSSWLVTYVASEGVLGVRFGPLGEVLDQSPIVLSGPAQSESADDPAFRDLIFSAPAIAFDGASYVATFIGSGPSLGVPGAGARAVWAQRASPAGQLIGGATLIEEFRSSPLGEIPLVPISRMASGAAEVFAFVTQLFCLARITPGAPCPIYTSLEAHRLIVSGEGLELDDVTQLNVHPRGVDEQIIRPTSVPAAAWNGRLTLSAWGDATLDSVFDGGYSAPAIAGALLGDAGTEWIPIATADEVASQVAVAGHRAGFLVVWTERTELRGRIVDDDGTPVGSDRGFAIASGTASAILTLGGVAATDDGYLTVWVSGETLHAARIDVEGTVGEPFVLDAGPVGARAAVAASESGYVVAFQRPNADLMGLHLPSAPR